MNLFLLRRVINFVSALFLSQTPIPMFSPYVNILDSNLTYVFFILLLSSATYVFYVCLDKFMQDFFLNKFMQDFLPILCV